ncbi:MAG: DUF4349 domain-containing protein [Armatimonadetes bacterium]|nr:DUF4349 domain-containing protein [Armatimonadota bacterium]
MNENLKAFIDGELNPEEQTQVAQEINKDQDLAEMEKFFRLIGEEIKTSAVQPEVSGQEATLKRLQGVTSTEMAQPDEPNLKLVTTRLRWAGFAAAALALFIVLPKMMGRMSASEDAASPTVGTGKDTMAKAAPSMERAAPKSERSLDPESLGKGGDDFKNSALDKDRTVSQGGDAWPYFAEEKVSGAPGSRQSQRENRSTVPGLRPLMIRTATLSVLVKDLKKATQSASDTVQAMGGFVQSSNILQQQGELGRAEIMLKVPEPKLEIAMSALRNLGEVTQEASNSDEVTGEVADVEARLKVLRIEEEQYVTMLRGTRRMGEILELKEKIGTLRQEIESLEAQRKALRAQTSYSTISLSLSERVEKNKPVTSGNWSEDTWNTATNALSAVGRFLGQLGIWSFIFAPLWVPVAGIWLYRRRNAK